MSAPVDEEYRLTPRTRAFLARRAALHGFDLLAPGVDEQGLADVVERRPADGGAWLRLRLRSSVRLPAGATALVIAETAGLVAGRVPGAMVSIAGERLPSSPGRALASPLHGLVSVTARRRLTLREVQVFEVEQAGRLVDRHPVHLELWPGQALRLPLPPRREGTKVDQVAVHWGSVEYTMPERRLPLGDWGYPYYLDGVLGDIGGVGPRGRVVLARGKFMEFDELENAHGFPPQRLHEVFVELRSRDGVRPVRPCRIAAVEVRYRLERRRPLVVREAVGGARPGSALMVQLPKRMRVDRVDVWWRDEGPAMGALVLGRAATPWANVCTGERKVFEFAPRMVDRLELKAALAPFDVERLELYGSET